MTDDPKTTLPPIPPRLRAVANCVVKGRPVVDIGTDHGLLAIFLVRTNLASHVVASDRARAPLERARQKVEIWSESDRISVRYGDGLTILRPEDDIATIVLAGMGGMSMVRTLDASRLAALPSVERVVVQANRDAQAVAEHMKSLGWPLVETVRGPAQRWSWSVDVFSSAGRIIDSGVQVRRPRSAAKTARPLGLAWPTSDMGSARLCRMSPNEPQEGEV